MAINPVPQDPLPRILRKFDVAYGCFMFCGVTALLVGGLSYVSMDVTTSSAFGFFVFIPMTLASLVAMAIGIGIAIKFYYYWPLGILALLSILFVAELVTESGSVEFFNLAPILYGTGACWISLWWFLMARKRWRRNI